MNFPKPQIGYYQAECCLLDLHKIETQEDLEAAEARIANNDECGPLMVFATLGEAVEFLDACPHGVPHRWACDDCGA